MIKKMLVLVLALFALPAAAGDWYTAGLLTNPAANAIMADTGAVPADATRRFSVVASSNVAMIVILEWRDATNAVTLRQLPILVPANDTKYVSAEYVPNFAAGERIRARLNSAITGTAQVVIQLE